MKITLDEGIECDQYQRNSVSISKIFEGHEEEEKVLRLKCVSHSLLIYLLPMLVCLPSTTVV